MEQSKSGHIKTAQNQQ